MLEKLKKSLDDAFHGIKTGTSKITLKAEERTKVTRLSLRVNTLKKDLESVIVRLGNEVYTFREEQRPGRVFQDGQVAALLDEADRIKEDMVKLEEEMNRVREDYELRIKGVDISEEAGAAGGEEKEKRMEAAGK